MKEWTEEQQKVNRAKFVEALRSGGYEQGEGMDLRPNEKKNNARTSRYYASNSSTRCPTTLCSRRWRRTDTASSSGVKKSRANEWVTVDALKVLQAAGRLEA